MGTMMTLEWDGLFFEGDNGDYDDMEWDSLSNQQFLRGDDWDDEGPEWDSLSNQQLLRGGRWGR